MTGKPEVLFLSHRIPYPPNKGDKIRSWRLLKHLTRSFRVHLACFVDDPADFEHAAFLRSVCASTTLIRLDPLKMKAKSVSGFVTGKPLSVAFYNDHRMRMAVSKLRKKPLVAEIAFSSTMAQYIRKAIPGRQRVIDFCDADSEKWRAYSEGASPPMNWIYAREGRRLAALETDIVNWADASFAITPAEATLFNCRPGLERDVGWWSNGVDADYFNPALVLPQPLAGAEVVFVGAMDYRANVEAITEFVDKVWPIVRKQSPSLNLAIVGANPVRKIHALDGCDGISVTGRVEDVRPWLQQAKLVVAPLRVARGIQNKVLEAMAMATPIVATPEAVTGISGRHDETYLVADNAAETAVHIHSLLNDDDKAARIGAAARALIVDRYRWPTQLQRLDRALGHLGLDYSSSSAALSVYESA